MNELIDKCLYNWLGYGNTNGDIWFIGTEEGGAEIWRDGISTLSLEESLKKRSELNLSCGFKEVWEDTYGIPLNRFKGLTTWHFMSAFILAMYNKKVNAISIRDFLFINKSLGSLDSNHFMCELFPLPKKSESDFPYKSRWNSVQEYRSSVIDKRFTMITDIIEKSQGAKLIIVYDRKTQALIKQRWKKGFNNSVTFEYNINTKKSQKYTLHFSSVVDKSIIFLFTPFFGQGQISYDGIVNAVSVLKEKGNICGSL